MPSPSELASTPSSLRHRLAALVAVVSLADFTFGALNVVQMTAAGLSPATIGIILATAGIVSSFAEAPSGALGDKYGQRRILVIGLVLWGAGQVGFGFSEATWLFTVSLILWAVGMACYSGAPFALVVNELNQLGREDLIGVTVRRTQVVRWIASAAGAALVFFFVNDDYPGVIVAVGGAALVGLALWVMLTWKESPRNADRSIGEILKEGLALATVGPYRAIAVYTALGSASLGIIVFAWQPIATHAGLSASILGLLLLVFTIASAFGAALSRFGEKTPATALTMALVVLAVALVATYIGGWVALIAVLVCELAIGFMLAITGVWSHQTFPDDLRNTMVSIMGVIGALSMALTDVLFGALWGALGVTLATSVLGGALLISTLVAHVLLRAHGSGAAVPPSMDDTPSADPLEAEETTR